MNRREAGISAMSLATMATSTLAFFILAVVASELQEEFAISKFEIGLLGAVNTGVGGLLAPSAGQLSDRLGGRNAMAVSLISAGVSAVMIALSPSYSWLLVSMAVAGITQGLGNPSCNKAIASGVLPERRGIITGVKQAGVQVAVFAAGFVVPWMSSSYGWRSAVWATAAISFASLAGLGLVSVLPSDSDAAADTEDSTGERLSTFVTQVALYGFLLGLVGGGLGRFLPLFAEEEVGFSIERAGQVFGLQGLVAIPCRLLTGAALDRGISARKIMAGMGVGGAISIMMILAATWGPDSLLWAGTVVAGMTLGSWNTAANLSMIRQGANAGRATGRLILGFLIGLTVGGPLVGWSIDTFDYSPAWIASAVVSVVGAAVVAARPGTDASLPLARQRR